MREGGSEGITVETAGREIENEGKGEQKKKRINLFRS